MILFYERYFTGNTLSFDCKDIATGTENYFKEQIKYQLT